MKKISLIFGGTRGIGSVIAYNLKKRGDEVYVVSRFKKNIKGIKHLKCDITSKEDIKNLCNSFKKKINNLIFSQRFRGDEIGADFKLLLEGTNNVIKNFSNKFSKNSSIVILSSIATSTVLHDQSEEYHYTRGALESLGKYYSIKFGKKGVRVNCIQPSKLIKPENKKFFFNQGKKEKKIIEKITPIGRIGYSEDIAYLCEFLTSDKSSFITGTIIPVDGGLRLVSQEGVYKIKK